MSDIFLSYSHQDADFMKRLRDYLRANSFEVWTDENLEPGSEAWTFEVQQALGQAHCLTVILSPDAARSIWVERELALAQALTLPIFPILLRGDERTSVPLRLISHQRIDATLNQGQALAALAEALYRHMATVIQQSPAATAIEPELKKTDPAPAAKPSPAELTRVVAKVGQADFRTIAEAIQRSPEGAQILVKPGLYRESLVLDRPVEIVGDGPLSDIVIETANQGCLIMQTDYAEVRGLTLRKRKGAQGDDYFAVDIAQGRLVLENCDITSDSLACIAIYGAATDPVIRRCRIHDGKAGGVFLYNNCQATLEDCDIFGNGLSAIEIKDGSTPTIQRCRVHDGKQGGIYFQEGGQGQVIDCDIYANTLAGLEIQTGSNPTVEHCRMYGGKAGGIFVWQNGQGIINDCDVYENELAGIEIKAGGAPAISRCTVHHGRTGGLFVWQGGLGLLTDCDISANTLAGVQISEAGNPTLRHCRICESKAGGVFVYEDGLGTLEDCDIARNALAGMEIKQGSNPLVQHCEIHGGQTGGVFVWENGLGTFVDCDIYENAYSGIEVRTGGHPTVRESRINRNTFQAIYVHDQGAATVENCNLTENTAGAWFIENGSKVTKRGNQE
jgi:F-box protein 11